MSMEQGMTYSLDDVLAFSNDDLFEIMRTAHALDLEAIADHTYTGIDLSMPSWFHRLMWKSFRKTFHKDPETGIVWGSNVKVEQVGWDTPPPAKRNAKGEPLTFGHYEVLSAEGKRFPRGWKGAHYLDYRNAGNPVWDFPANRGYCPLFAVNEGDMGLLLGWEVFHVGVQIPITDFWVLRREGPLAASEIVSRPDNPS